MAVGIGLAFGGYTLIYFGYCSIRGPGVGLLDLLIPGRTVTIPTGTPTNTGGAASAPSKSASGGSNFGLGPGLIA